MQQLFSGKLRFKDENGNDYPDWEEKKLGEACKINPKSSTLPSSFIYIDLESVVDGQLLKETEIQLSEAPSRAQRSLSMEDILFQTVRPYQKNNLFFNRKGDYIASTGYAQLRAKQSPQFIYQLLHTTDFLNKVMDRCTGTSYPAINSTALSNIIISIPCAKEQQKIANVLSSIDVKIDSVNQQITQTQNFKKGLLQQLFV
jgi:type I restriction enzyme S subunit